MKKFKDLYGLDNDPKVLHQMSYLSALWTKVDWAKARIVELEKAHYLWRDHSGITDCLSSIKHNRSLIYEYKENP